MPNSCTTWPNRETLWHQRLLPLPAPLLSKAVMNYPGHGICTHTDRPTMFVIPAYRLSFRERALGPISPYLSQLTVIYGRAAVSDHATIKFSASKLPTTSEKLYNLQLSEEPNSPQSRWKASTPLHVSQRYPRPF